MHKQHNCVLLLFIGYITFIKLFKKNTKIKISIRFISFLKQANKFIMYFFFILSRALSIIYALLNKNWVKILTCSTNLLLSFYIILRAKRKTRKWKFLNRRREKKEIFISVHTHTQPVVCFYFTNKNKQKYRNREDVNKSILQQRNSP